MNLYEIDSAIMDCVDMETGEIIDPYGGQESLRKRLLEITDKEHFDEDKMEAHHIVSWARGGRTVSTNCALICKDCHTKRHY